MVDALIVRDDDEEYAGVRHDDGVVRPAIADAHAYSDADAVCAACHSRPELALPSRCFHATVAPTPCPSLTSRPFRVHPFYNPSHVHSQRIA